MLLVPRPPAREQVHSIFFHSVFLVIIAAQTIVNQLLGFEAEAVE